jgi:transposase
MKTGKGNCMAERRKSYTTEFKVQAVELLTSSGKTGHPIEEELGIGQGTIYRWRRQLEENEGQAFPGKGNERDKELARLQRENTELREEREILRKALRHLPGSTPEMKYQFMEQQT